MSKVYVVMGTSGEYSDRNEWPVIAYFDKEKAEQHIKNATQEANKIFQNKPIIKNKYCPQKGVNKYDLEMTWDYGDGCSYFMYEVELIEGERLAQRSHKSTKREFPEFGIKELNTKRK